MGLADEGSVRKGGEIAGEGSVRTNGQVAEEECRREG
jgi:hypothetical protein